MSKDCAAFHFSITNTTFRSNLDDMLELAGGADASSSPDADAFREADTDSIDDDTEDNDQEESDAESLFVKDQRPRAKAKQTNRHSSVETEESSMISDDESMGSDGDGDDDDSGSDDENDYSPDEDEEDDAAEDEAFTQAFADGSEELAVTQLRQMPITNFMTRGYIGQQASQIMRRSLRRVC
jgi:hypothetical protein